ncbi:DNA topoisomerase IB [Demequina sp. NBRC 110057]|uniref:DNA topoisomerase IB n=1 Tax=Demequina sp. NBRC 110057 TaxID=1570346 RepID=UPI0009FEF0F6|nr:DNA topoisomerase IB [Demequina sp. NBRC 110057]
MPRLRRSRPSEPGITRRRSGRGWTYRDPHGRTLRDSAERERIDALAIPPAWTDVWICPEPHGHLQALGTDEAGRRQYLYHPAWRERRDRAKHTRVLEVAAGLPAARAVADADAARDDLSREHVLGIAFRLLDRGLFRIGGAGYAADNGSYGLATVLREHARVSGDEVTFDYVAKSGKDRHVVVRDPEVAAAISTLKRRSGDGDELLAYRVSTDPVRWRDLASDDINGYIQMVVQPDASAKDFRTWHGTVIAAQALGAADAAEDLSATARKKVVAGVMREVAAQLGNTPAVARASYVDPRVVDLWEDGVTIEPVLDALGEHGEELSPGARDAAIQAALEQAVVDLLTTAPDAREAQLRRDARRARAIARAVDS